MTFARLTPQNLEEALSEHLLIDHLDLTYDISRSHGNYLYDSKHDRFLLDCFSFIASNPIGHNHPMMDDPEFEKKLLKCAKVNPSNSDILCMEYAEAVEAIASHAKIEPYKHLFFIAGGSSAVDNALKTAFDWKLKKNFNNGIYLRPEELGIVHFHKSFHGRSLGPLSTMNKIDPRKSKHFPSFWWSEELRLSPNCSLDDNRRLMARKNQIAAIIVEPIQGEGGDTHFCVDFHYNLRRLANDLDCLLIFDEVQTGFGLTGKFWAFQHFFSKKENYPDIVCFGKKAQVCGIMARGDKMAEVSQNVFTEKSRINSTWGANLVDFVRCQRYLEIMDQQNLIENAKEVGTYFLDSLKILKDSFPFISRVRGKGLMCAFDLESTEQRNRFVSICLKNELLLLGCGEKSIRFRPSLTFSEDNVRKCIEILRKSLEELVGN